MLDGEHEHEGLVEGSPPDPVWGDVALGVEVVEDEGLGSGWGLEVGCFGQCLEESEEVLVLGRELGDVFVIIEVPPLEQPVDLAFSELHGEGGVGLVGGEL